MDSWFWNRVNPELATQVVLIVVLLGFALWLKWPEIKQRVSEAPLKERKMEEADKSLSGQIAELRSELRDVKDKLDAMGDKLSNDFVRINRLEHENDRIRNIAEDSLEEREILIHSMLGVLQGMQELGANGPTKDAEKKIREYLNGKAHRIEGGKTI